MKAPRTSGMQKGRGRARGITLLELIIAMGVSAALAASIYAVIVAQSRTYNIQDATSRMQQSLRLGMDFITRNVSMAGYGTPGYTLTETTLGVSGFVPAIRGYDGGTGGSDALQVVYADPTKLAMTSWSINQACTTTALTMANTSDALLFKDASYMLCFDYSNTSLMASYLFAVTGYNNSTGVVAVTVPSTNTSYSGATGECPSTGNLPRDLQCGAANVLTFYIDRSNTDGVGPGSAEHPTLMMSTSLSAFSNSTGAVPQSGDISLTDNVEDLQLEVCTTTTSASCDTPAAWTAYSSALNTVSGVTTVRQIRVSLWARTETAKSETVNISAANPLTGLRDGYHRQRLQATIFLRNLAMLAYYN